MAETSPAAGALELLASDDGREVDRPKATAAALLLQPAPVQTLRAELDKISELGPHFYALNMGIRYHLRDDPHANHLRKTLMQFNVPMNSASGEMRVAFLSGQDSYVHNWDERSPTQRTGPATEIMIERLLNPTLQAKIVKRAGDAANQAAKAAKIIRDKVIPLLPLIQENLEDYVSDYSLRVNTKLERQRSWIPSVLQSALWGSVAPTPWNLDSVKELPQRVSTANDLLRQLPAFLDNLELHFRRLSELRNEQVEKLGYTASDDLARLYQDRLICSQEMARMGQSWYSALKAFGVGAGANAAVNHT